MNLDSIWSLLMEIRTTEEIQALPTPITIPNSFSHKEYTLTHRFHHSATAFIGHDSSLQKFHIKVFGVPSFDQVKSVYKNLQLVKEHSSDLKLIEVVDTIEFFENGRWVMLLITPYFEGFTLEELTAAMYINGFHLTKEESISVFLEILGLIRLADGKGFMISSMPDNLFFVRSGVGGTLKGEKNWYELKVLATSLQWLSCGRSKIEKLYPANGRRNSMDGMIWGAGLCLYAFVSSEPLSALPALNEVNDIERAELLKFHYKDEAVMTFVRLTVRINKPQNLLSHYIIKIWKALLNLNWDEIDSFGVKQMTALMSGLTMESQICKMLAMRKILMIAQENSTEVCTMLTKSELLYTFVETSHGFDWYSFPNLITSVFLILKDKVASRTVKEKLVSMRLFSILVTAINVKANSDILCDFISKFFDDTTLTILEIAWTNGFVNGLLEKPVKSPSEMTFIKYTMSYYGPNSVELIKRVYETIEINESLVNKHLHEIPYYFKLEKSHLVVQMMHKILERNARSQGDTVLDMLKVIVLILAEVLCVPKMLQYHHITCQCTSLSKKKFLTDQGRNPLLIKCKACAHSYCAMCKAQNHEGHDYQYVLYQNPLHRCNSVNPVEPTTEYFLDLFQPPKYQSRISFCDSLNNTTRSSNTIFYSSGYLRISTIEPLVCKDPTDRCTLVYFEVKVHRAGIQENIEIGVEGSGIVYKSADGGIYFHGTLVGKGPRFGSYDTVGIGVTTIGKAYITYNGLLNWPLIDCDVLSEMRPVVVMNSEGGQIEVLMRAYLFQPTREQSENQDFINPEMLMVSEKLLESLCKHIKKVYNKNQKDEKAQDLLDKFTEILKTVKKNALIEKLGVKKSKFWPR
jgi:hypothetical protein